MSSVKGWPSATPQHQQRTATFYLSEKIAATHVHAQHSLICHAAQSLALAPPEAATAVFTVGRDTQPHDVTCRSATQCPSSQSQHSPLRTSLAGA